MDAQEVRLLRIEGQIHALAQAWLYLAGGLEMRGAIDPVALEQAMLGVNWRGAPLEPHAHQMMQGLVAQLADAREERQRQSRYRTTGHEE